MSLDPTLRTFLFGVMGSVAVEIVKVLAYYQNGGRFPSRYSRWGYWAARALLALIGGGLAVAYGVQSDVVAVHIGASTPAIIGMFARKPPE